MSIFNKIRSSNADLTEEYQQVKTLCESFISLLNESYHSDFDISFESINGETIEISNEKAKSLAKIYDRLNEENRKRFEMIAVSSPKGIEYLNSFADSQEIQG